MKSYSLSNQGGSNIILEGADIVSAIENNFKTIAKVAGIGNAAGYRLVKVKAYYAPGILGGKGGCEVLIVSTGSELAHTKDVGPETANKVWIGGVTPEELPKEYIFELV